MLLKFLYLRVQVESLFFFIKMLLYPKNYRGISSQNLIACICKGMQCFNCVFRTLNIPLNTYKPNCQILIMRIMHACDSLSCEFVVYW